MTTINSVNIVSTTITKKSDAITNSNTDNDTLLSLDNSGVSQTTSVKQIHSAEDAVDFACKELGINLNSPEYQQLKFDVTHKYKTMLRIAEAQGEKLDSTVVHVRIKNYVKGWAFNQFEQNAVTGKNAKNWEYNAPADLVKKADDGDEDAKNKLLLLLKENYNNLADAYIEFYDGDGNGSIDIIEMFAQELTEHYANTLGLPKDQARSKALEKATQLSKMSMVEIANSKDESDEMLLFQLLQTKFGMIEDTPIENLTIEDLRTLSKEEIKPYLLTKANYDGSGSNTITPKESNNIEFDILQGKDNVLNWFSAARKMLEQ